MSPIFGWHVIELILA